jgi:hypothetical protein
MDLARAERLSKLSLDYRVALAHSPIQPQHVTAVTGGWLEEDEGLITYGFILRYRERYVYLYGIRDISIEHTSHGMRWFDEEPTFLYSRAINWDHDIAEILNGPYFLSDDEAGRETEDRDNSDPE